MAKFDDTIKLDNFKAHYEIILGNIQIANSELDTIHKSIDSGKIELEGVVAACAIAHTELNDLKTKRDSVNEDIHDRLSLITERELNIVKEENDASEVIVNLKKVRDELTSEISGKQRELDSLNQSISELSSKLSRMQEIADTLSNKVDSLQNLVVSLDGNIAELRTVHRNIIDEHEAVLAGLISSIEDTSANKIAEEAKMFTSEAYYKKKDEDYARREGDIVRIVRRLQRYADQIMPGLVVKI